MGRDIEWMKRIMGRRKEVRIRFHRQKGDVRLYVSFIKDVAMKAFPNATAGTAYIRFGFSGNRMYFMETDKYSEGYCLTPNEPSTIFAFVRNLHSEKRTDYVEWLDDYKLEYDNEEQLYFIERGERISDYLEDCDE